MDLHPNPASVTGNTKNKQHTMKSKRNLTRFTYETTAFQGWRLCISRGGSTFTRYFSDRQYGGARKALAAAEKRLGELRTLLDGARRVNGKLSQTTVRKANKLLEADR